MWLLSLLVWLINWLLWLLSWLRGRSVVGAAGEPRTGTTEQTGVEAEMGLQVDRTGPDPDTGPFDPELLVLRRGYIECNTKQQSKNQLKITSTCYMWFKRVQNTACKSKQLLTTHEGSRVVLI